MKKSEAVAEPAVHDDLRESEELFRLMVNSARDAIVVLDHEGKVTFWNRSAAELLGYAWEEIPEGESHRWLLPERYHDAYRKGFRHFQKTDETMVIGRTLEAMVKRIDGKEIPVEVSVSSVMLQGRWHALGIMRDISEHKRSEEKLNHERDLLRSLMEHSDDLIYFKDLQSRFLRCSRAQITRFQALGIKDILGKTDHDFFSNEHADDALRDEQEIIRTGESLIGKVEKETWPDGSTTWALTSKMPLRNEAGEIIGTFGISKDITKMKEAELKLDAMHQLVEASRQAGMAEVATSVLHNIGNVITSVNVSSSLIAEKIRGSKVLSLSKVVALLQTHANDLPGFFSTDPKGRQLIGYLEQLAGHLEEERGSLLHEAGRLCGNIQHIKEVIDMQQDAARTLGLVETLPVADMVEDALRLNLGGVERHGIELVREYASVPSVSVEKHKVLQILVNLIRNAMHACKDSGRSDKRIILRITQEKGRVLISVEDNGVGIAQENLTRIFSHGFTTRREGHGFGLHSGAMAAKDLGGALTAYSKGSGEGALFTLELPLKARRKR